MSQKDNLVFMAEQALANLEMGATSKRYDPSWIRPMSMSREDIATSCQQAYHWIHQLKAELESINLPSQPSTDLTCRCGVGGTS